MYKKMIFCFMSFFIGIYVFAQDIEITGVKITSYGNGYFVMELDEVGQCIPLQVVKSTPGWVEVICSDVAKKVTATAVGEGVKWAVEAYIAKYTAGLSVVAGATPQVIALKRYASRVAQAVATWATKLGHEALCDYLAGRDFYEVVRQPYSW